MFDKEAFTGYVDRCGWYDRDKIGEGLAVIDDFNVFLSQRGIDDSNALTREDVSAYVAKIRERSKDTYAAIAIIALYGEFIKNETLASEAFLLFDAANVMNRMSELTKETLGQETWQKIFGDIGEMPEIGWTLDEMSAFARELEKRFLAAAAREQYEHICTKNAHAWNPEWNGNDREKFLALQNVDKFIEAFNDDFMKALESSRDSGELFYAQAIDGGVIDYMRENPVCRREGNKLYLTKIPFNVRRYLNETDKKMKRYHACHCPWAKQSILQQEGPLSRSFCHCSLGHDKKNFDVAFGQELTGRAIETVMDENGLKCIFECDIPDDIMKRYCR